MRIVLFLLLLAGCATAERPYAPVDQVDYSALGEDPFWMATIGDDVIVLALGAEPGSGEKLRSLRFPRVLPQVTDGVTRWQSGEGTQVVTVEARPGPCETARGTRYRDRVTVSLSGRQLSGCGGRILGKG